MSAQGRTVGDRGWGRTVGPREGEIPRKVESAGHEGEQAAVFLPAARLHGEEQVVVVDPSNFKALFDELDLEALHANSAADAKPKVSPRRRFFGLLGPRLTPEEKQREAELRAFVSLANDAYPIDLAKRRKTWRYRLKNWWCRQSRDLLERLLSILPRR